MWESLVDCSTDHKSARHEKGQCLKDLGIQKVSLPSRLGQKNTSTASLQRDKTSQQVLGYDTKQSECQVPVMLGLWGMWSNPLLPLLTGLPRPRMVAPERALSIGWIELNCILMLNWIVWIRTIWLNWIAWNRNVFDN